MDRQTLRFVLSAAAFVAMISVGVLFAGAGAAHAQFGQSDLEAMLQAMSVPVPAADVVLPADAGTAGNVSMSAITLYPEPDAPDAPAMTPAPVPQGTTTTTTVNIETVIVQAAPTTDMAVEQILLDPNLAATLNASGNQLSTVIAGGIIAGLGFIGALVIARGQKTNNTVPKP